MLVDTKSYDLAVYFLDTDASEAAKNELAEWIQYHVELWLNDDRQGLPWRMPRSDLLGAGKPETK